MADWNMAYINNINDRLDNTEKQAIKNKEDIIRVNNKISYIFLIEFLILMLTLPQSLPYILEILKFL